MVEEKTVCEIFEKKKYEHIISALNSFATEIVKATNLIRCPYDEFDEIKNKTRELFSEIQKTEKRVKRKLRKVI